MSEGLSFLRKAAWSLGQFGWSLASYGAANFLTQFYLPFAEGGKALFPVMIFQGAVAGVLTVIGLALAFGRIFDAVTDPLVAMLSDRSPMRLGRRRGFLALSALPFALFSFLVFVPVAGAGPGADQTLNSLWLFVSLTLLYIFMTLYVTPYFAWMSELGRSADERLQLSTMISITWALGAMTGAQGPALQGLFQQAGMEALPAFQAAMGIFAGAGFVCMMVPVLAVRETPAPAAARTVVTPGFRADLGRVLKDRNFLVFTLSDFAYWLGLYFINNGLLYYLTVLLGLPKETYSFLFILMFLASFAFYVPVGILARKTGRRRLMAFAFVMFGLLFAFCGTFGVLPLPPMASAVLAAVLAAVPLSIFGILPNAMVSDMAEAHARTTGVGQAGLYFGFRTFMSKMGQSLGAALLPGMVMLGASGEGGGGAVVGALGVRLTTLAALVFCAAGLVMLLRYDEKKVMGELAGPGYGHD